MSDGGEVSNGPSEIFTNRKDYNPAHLLHLTFDRFGEAFDIMHRKKHRGILEAIVEFVQRIFVGGHFVEAEEQGREKIRNLGPHALVVPHGDIGTLSFSPRAEKVSSVKKAAFNAGKRYGRYLRDEAVSHCYATAEEAYASLSKQEKLSIYNSAEFQSAIKKLDLDNPQHKFYLSIAQSLLRERL